MIIAIVLFLVGCSELENELRGECLERVQVITVGSNGWASCCPDQKMGLQIIQGPGAQQTLVVTCTSSKIDNQVGPIPSVEIH